LEYIGAIISGLFWVSIEIKQAATEIGMEATPMRAWILKLLFVASLAAVSGAVLFAQAQKTGEPNIEILKLHWEKQVRLPRNFDPSIISTGSTFNDPASRASSGTGAIPAADATRVATSNQRAAAGSNPTFPGVPGRLSVVYVYSMKLKNLSSKTIEGIAWDYLFIDPDTKAELGKHQFLSYERVPPARVATMQAQLRSAPTKVVRVENTGNNKHPKLVERSMIQCVLFADDTVWKSANARDGVCEMLKNSKALMKRKSG